MIECGILTKYDKVELLNGVMFEKMPKGTKYASLTDELTRFFYRILGEKVIVRNQNPIWLDEFSEPEPDIVLAAPDAGKYFKKHPEPADIYLILEVSDSTLAFDRNTKAAAYARAGIRHYLLINVQAETIEDYREPSADGYQFKQTLRAGQTFNLAAFPEVEINAGDFLPGAANE